jgi:hypothetical protein
VGVEQLPAELILKGPQKKCAVREKNPSLSGDCEKLGR